MPSRFPNNIRTIKKLTLFREMTQAEWLSRFACLCIALAWPYIPFWKKLCIPECGAGFAFGSLWPSLGCFAFAVQAAREQPCVSRFHIPKRRMTRCILQTAALRASGGSPLKKKASNPHGPYLFVSEN